MKKSTWTKKIAALALSLVLAAGSAVGVFASDLPDPNQKGSITVHKYATTSSSQTPGAGLELSPSDAAGLGTPLKDVGFTLHKVTAEVTYQTSVQQALLGATSLGEQKTDAAGVTAWSDLDVGYYVLEETTPPAGNYAPSAPAIIRLPIGLTTNPNGEGWNYDVHVYPKNVNNNDIIKEVTSTESQYNVGDTVSWKIEGKVKAGLRDGADAPFTYGSMKVIDPLDKRLTFTAGSDVVSLVGGTTFPAIPLVRGTDYTVDDVNNTVTWQLTAAGIDKIFADGAQSIRITLDTVVNAKAQDGTPAGSASITNGASIEYKSADGNTIETPAVDPADKPAIDLAGIVIKKIDGNNPTILLDGAEFKIASSLDNAKAGTYLKRGEAATEDIIIVTGDDATTSEVEEGWAMFTGLPLNAGAATTFYLVETKAPTGYIKRQSIIEVTIPAGDKKVSIEVKNQKIGDPAIEEDTPTFQLPTTGGIGTALFAIVGLSLMGGAAFLFFKNRRSKEQKI